MSRSAGPGDGWGKGARQQKPAIKLGHAALQKLILAVENTGRFRRDFADEEKIAILKFFGADGADPFAPVSGSANPGILAHELLDKDCSLCRLFPRLSCLRVFL